MIVQLKMQQSFRAQRAIDAEYREPGCFKTVQHVRRSRYWQAVILPQDDLAEYFLDEGV